MKSFPEKKKEKIHPLKRISLIKIKNFLKKKEDEMLLLAFWNMERAMMKFQDNMFDSNFNTNMEQEEEKESEHNKYSSIFFTEYNNQDFESNNELVSGPQDLLKSKKTSDKKYTTDKNLNSRISEESSKEILSESQGSKVIKRV